MDSETLTGLVIVVVIFALAFGMVILMLWLQKKGIISSNEDEDEKPRRSSSSSYSSSSRRSGDDVQVKIKFSWQRSKNGMALPVTEEVSMSYAEYKSLLNGSMKARVAYVTNNFKAYAITGKVSDVSISLA